MRGLLIEVLCGRAKPAPGAAPHKTEASSGEKIVALADRSLPSFKVVPSESRFVEGFTAARPSAADRMAAGRALRMRVPRSSLAEYKPSSEAQRPRGDSGGSGQDPPSAIGPSALCARVGLTVCVPAGLRGNYDHSFLTHHSIGTDISVSFRNTLTDST